MTAIIKPLGMSEEEITEIEKSEGQWKKSERKLFLDMYHTPRPSESDLAEFETVFGELPSEYRNFLKSFNGGVPEPNTFVTKDNELVINYFFPLKYPKNYPDGIYEVLENYAARIPKGMIPIASGGGGDLVLIKLDGGDRGKLYYWYHELESEADASSYYENIELLAATLNDFISLLCEVE